MIVSNNKTYCKELDKSNGGYGPGPGYYNAENHKAISLPKIKNKRPNFGTKDRGMEFKKEEGDSPSPFKYDAQYEFKGTKHQKGFTFGSAPKRLSFC